MISPFIFNYTSRPNPVNVYMFYVLVQGSITFSQMSCPLLSLNRNVQDFTILPATRLINSNMDLKSCVMLSSFLVKYPCQVLGSSLYEINCCRLGKSPCIEGIRMSLVIPCPSYPYAEHTVFWQCLWNGIVSLAVSDVEPLS